MKKINILKKNTDFTRIINTLRPVKSRNFIVYLEKTETPDYHFGFSVGKKIGTAVVRNKVKRQLKNIIDKKDYKNGFNCIIIVKRGILSLTYQEMNSEIFQLLEKLDIIKEKQDATKTN